MKKYIIIIFLSILGYITNISLSDSNNYLYDIEYSKEYSVNVSSFPDGCIPSHTKFSFRLEVNPKKKNSINIKMLKGEDTNLSLGVYFFSKKPSDDEAENSSGSSSEYLSNVFIGNDNPYLKYEYFLENIHSEKYMVVRFSSYIHHYLSIYVSSYKERKSMDFLQEIKYNKEFVFKDVGNYIHGFLFYVNIPNDDDGTIRIKLHENDTFDNLRYFDVDLEEFYGNPAKGDSDPFNIRTLKIYKKEKDNNTQLIKYYYRYNNLKEGVRYLLILISNLYDLKYFSIGVGDNITDYNGSFKLKSLKHIILALLFLML